ncbi:MAG: zinc ABC transporter solute-binding protein [Peptococcaceae bacterium]|nr:zinc ABC transporter solute-binding protein [Peptococcaceae bacterium]
MYKKLFIITALFFSLLIAGCGQSNPIKPDLGGDKKLQVYTSIYPIFEFTKQIGGDRISLKNIIPPGSEPHDWEPSPQIIAEILNGDILILSGSGAEPWAGKILDIIDLNKTKVIYAGANVPLMDAKHNDLKKNQALSNISTDPHIWLDPLNSKIMVNNITDSLIKLDESNKKYYIEKSKAYIQELDKLDQEFLSGLKNTSHREFITSHDAFGYLAKRYGLVQIPIRGLTAEGEPSPADMARIIGVARERKIKYIFFEASVSPKVSETVASEIKGGILALNPLENLSTEELASGKDYLSVMRENLNNLIIALGDK